MKEKTQAKKITSKSGLIRFIIIRATLTSFVLFFLLVSTCLIAYHVAYWEKIYPGVRIGDIHLGNLTLDEATKVIQSQASSIQTQNIILKYANQETALPLSTLEVGFDATATAQLAFNLGRGKNPVLNFEDKWRAFNQGVNLQAKYSLNEAVLEKNIAQIAEKIDSPPEEATIKVSGDKVEVTSSRNGTLLNQAESREKIKKSLAVLDVPTMTLESRPAVPQITEAKAQAAKKETEKILSQPLVLKFEGQAWTFEKERLANFLAFSSQKEVLPPAIRFSLNGAVFEIKGIYAAEENLEEKTGTALSVSFSQERIKEAVSNIAKEINQDPVDARFKFDNGKVAVFVPHQAGRELDETTTIEKITAALKSGEREIPLPVKIKNPAMTNENVNNFNIKELLGRGTSKFAGSIANRVYNIGLAAGRINGTLIAPGETFSMYKVVGEVDGTTGYKEAYVISNGRTQLDFGGGVCQVSTTLFRAVLNAGLPVSERHPHAYRVGYYEQDMPPGADASVYFPYSDFKFKNDTPGYLLIQTIPDLKNYLLTFEIYGTSDGRKAEVGNFWLGNQVPAPAPLYQDDPTLPKGTKKQIDWAAVGADASFTRTVTRNGEVIISDKFFSRYKAWQAVYLVGTKE